MSTTTLTRAALWERRKTATAKLATLRTYQGTLCGCARCGDSSRIEELAALIARATQAVDELGNRYCERTPTC